MNTKQLIDKVASFFVEGRGLLIDLLLHSLNQLKSEIDKSTACSRQGTCALFCQYHSGANLLAYRQHGQFILILNPLIYWRNSEYLDITQNDYFQL